MIGRRNASSWWRQQTERLRQKEAATRKRQERQQHEDYVHVVGALHGIESEQRASRYQEHTYERKKGRREGLTIIGVFATAVAAIITVVVSHCDTNRTLSEARTAANTQHADTLAALQLATQANQISEKAQSVIQRAFVFSNGTLVYGAFNRDTPPKEVAAVQVQVTNSGNTPTLNLTTIVHCGASPQVLDDPWALLKTLPKMERVQGYLGPHDSKNSTCTFTVDEVKAAIAGSAHLYVLGDFHYQDRITPDKSRRTEFSWEINDVEYFPGQYPILRPHFGGRTDNVGHHNCADEECPKD